MQRITCNPCLLICVRILKSSWLQMVVEPSGAVGLAAALTDEFRQLAMRRGLKKIGVILSGGNVDLAEAGLWHSLSGQR